MDKRERKLTERLSAEVAWHHDFYEGKSTGKWMRSSLWSWLYSKDTARVADHFYRERVLQNLPDGNILEIGAGDTHDSIRLAQHGKSVYASDISESAIRSMQRRARGLGVEVQGIVCAAEYLPFCDDAFDMTIGESILHHTQLEVSLQEIRRVTTVGGKCIFREPLQGHIFLKLFRRFTPDSRTPDEHTFTPGDLKLLEELFEVNESRSFFLLTLLSLPFALLSPRIAVMIWKFLDRIDQTLVRVAPFTRRWFWQMVVVLRSSD